MWQVKHHYLKRMSMLASRVGERDEPRLPIQAKEWRGIR